jgi:predicted permease
MGSLRMDLRYALRLMRKNPAFTATVVLILALGIGANAAIYSIVDAVLLQALPGHNAHELVRLYTTAEQGGANTGAFSFPSFSEYRANLTSFSGLAAHRVVVLQVSQRDGTAQRIPGSVVSGNFFDVLGVDATYGRLFSASDDGPRGSNPVAVISERFWKEHFDGRPDAIRSVLHINGHAFTISGVAPSAMQQFERGPQIWLPLSMAIEAEPMMATQIDRFGNDFFHVVARLKPGVSIETAQAELDLVSARLGSGTTVRLWDGMAGQVVSPSDKPPTSSGDWEMYDWQKPWARVARATTGFSREEDRLSCLLLGVAVLVLLLATADVAGLLLARADHEFKEFAIRASLGASRWTLFRQKLVQGLLLAGLGGMAGLVAAHWTGRLLFASAPQGLPLPVGIAASVLDGRVVAFVLGLVAVTALGFTALTAMRDRGSEISEALKRQSAGFSGKSGRGPGLQSMLVIGQIVASIVLMVGAALLLETMRNVARIDLGYETEHVLSASIDLSRDGYTKGQGAAMLQPILEKLRSIPGASSVALVNGNPVRWRAGKEKAKAAVCNNLPMVMVSPEYFHTLSIALLRGRDFTAADTKGSPGAVILNQAAANLCWPGDPIGKSYSHLLTVAQPFEVVGIVGNVRVDEMNDTPQPQMYTPLAQFYDALPWQFAFNVLVRTSMNPHAMAPALTAQIRSLDPNIMLYDMQTPRELLTRSYVREQFLTRILGVFGALGLVLAVAGLYGLLAYVTAKRTKEFGVRAALGALPRQILQLVLSQGGRLIGFGVLLGLLAAAGATRLLQSLLFGVSATDARVFLLASVPFVAAGLLACWLPARRAAAVDPMVALRDE